MPAQDQASPTAPPPRLPGRAHVIFFGRNWKFTLARLAVLVAVCFIVFRFILLPIRVQGISMLPTYRTGSIAFVNRLAYLWHSPRCGDVVGIRLSPPSIREPSIMYLKRVIGLPGETVAFVHGHALINGHVLAEPYVKNHCDWNLPPVKLGSNQYYVVGDNRSLPPGDLVHGKVERKYIVGKAIL